MIDGLSPVLISEQPAPIQAAPFRAGDRVLPKKLPFVAETVVRCEPYGDGRGWFLETKLEHPPGSPTLISGPADRWMPAPADWQDCPVRAPSPIDLLELETDRAISEEARREAEAAATGAAQTEAKIRHYQQRHRWAETHLRRISPTLAAAELRGCDQMLDLLGAKPAANPLPATENPYYQEWAQSRSEEAA